MIHATHPLLPDTTARRRTVDVLASRFAFVVLTALLVGCTGGPTDVSVADLDDEQRTFLAAMMEEEDRRPAALDAELLASGVASTSPTIRRFAARGLGRLQDPAAIPLLAEALADGDAGVRAEAANGIAQSVYGQDAGAAADLLHARLAEESDASARGAIAQALGRIRPSASDELERNRDTLVELTRGAPLGTLLPTMRGIESLARMNRADFELDEASRARIAELARYGRSGAEGFVEPDDDGEADVAARTATARVRRLALAALTAASVADADTVETALYDPDIEVRRLAAAAAPTIADPTSQAMLLSIALADDAARVRYEGLAGYGRQLRGSLGCGPIFEAVEDTDPHVVLQAIDLLARPCPAAAPGEETEVTAVLLLRMIAESLPGLASSDESREAGSDDAIASAESRTAVATIGWHYGAHALAALTALEPTEAEELIPGFAAHPTWQVRMYAARAAATVSAVDVLEQLTGDPDANVAEAALRGLATNAGEDATVASIRALERDDYQLLMTAANTLEASSDDAALPALLAALERITTQQRETSRDPRRALLERIGELGDADQTDALRPYLNDFDPAIARQAAEILLAWTGANVSAAPRPPAPQPFPSLDALLELDRSRALIYMAGGGAVAIELHPFEAPTNVARFVEQARAGYFDGLTFHRVVPNFVIQGGSPGANEYVGAGSFSRDELSGHRSHLRGTVGISTRGRDTGDGQIFVNLVDNLRLDHNFTIIGTVTAGVEIVDAVLEGGTILRIVVEPMPGSE